MGRGFVLSLFFLLCGKILSMIKLIATDLDGTLFYPKHRIFGIPTGNQRFLKKFIRDGGKVVLVSGRNPKVLHKVESQLGSKVDLIGCNGGYFLDEKGFHDKHPLDREKLLELYSFLHRNYGVWLWMCFDESNVLYCNTRNVPKWIERGFRFGNFFRFYFAETLICDDSLFLDRLTNHDCYKMLLAFGLGKDGERKASQAAPALYERYKDSFEIASSSQAVEITAKGINKGLTLSDYCKAHGYSKDEVFVCGDSGNDLTMFASFPHSFAMSHSSEAFKSNANHVIDRISDLEEYLDTPSLYEKDSTKEFDVQKALENLA